MRKQIKRANRMQSGKERSDTSIIFNQIGKGTAETIKGPQIDAAVFDVQHENKLEC